MFILIYFKYSSIFLVLILFYHLSMCLSSAILIPLSVYTVVFCNMSFLVFLYLKPWFSLANLIMDSTELLSHYSGCKSFLPFCVEIYRQAGPFLLFMFWCAPTFHMDSTWWEGLFIPHHSLCFLKDYLTNSAIMKTIPLRSKLTCPFLFQSL